MTPGPGMPEAHCLTEPSAPEQSRKSTLSCIILAIFLKIDGSQLGRVADWIARTACRHNVLAWQLMLRGSCLLTNRARTD